MTLSGKIAIVTGGARGLGHAYALHLSGLGARVAVFDIDLEGGARYGESLDEEAQSRDAQLDKAELDLTDQDAVNAAVERVQRDYGRIDILVNNAGGAIAPAERSKPSIMPAEDIRLTLDVNLMSTIYCCQAVAPHMKRRQSGVIVNTSSLSGRTVADDGSLAHYSVAKAAITHFTRNLAAELGPFGIRVNAIAPGIILTGRIKALAKERGIGTGDEVGEIPLRRLGNPEDCARVIEFLASDLSGYVTGQCISVCGGMELSPA